MKTKIIILGIIISIFISCNNDENEKQIFTPILPEITQTGENIFGCYINGKLLTPRDGSGGIYGINKGIVYSVSPDDLSYNEIYIDDWKSEKGGLLRFHITDLHQNGEGTYTINRSNCQNGLDATPNINIHCRVYDETEQIFKWYCSIENAGTLIITRYDLNNHIVSGTFNCTVQNQNNHNKQIEITDGRFDIKWDTLDQTIFP